MHSSEKKKKEINTDVSGWDELVKNLNARLKLEKVYRYHDITRLVFFKNIRKIGFINFKSIPSTVIP